MTIRGDWYECDSRFIPAHGQPAVLIDLALSRGSTATACCGGPGCSTRTSSPVGSSSARSSSSG